MQLYAYGQLVNVLKHLVYVSDGCRKQFEVAVGIKNGAQVIQNHKI
jgi:hypothetical protein